MFDMKRLLLMYSWFLVCGIKNLLVLQSIHTRKHVRIDRSIYDAIRLPEKYGDNINASNLKVYVISLQGVSGSHVSNNHRFDNFSLDLQRKCGHGVDIEFCPAIISTRRGYGTQKAFLNCFTKALSDQQNYSVFMEDDARLKTVDFCNDSYRDSIWAAAKRDVFMILLGGHHTQTIPFQKKNKLSRAMYSHGSYGFMVRRENLKLLFEYYTWELSLNKPSFSPDTAFFKVAFSLRKSVQITTPSVVEHIAGFSNTWNRSRTHIN
jgi:hypothetical protein